MSELILYLVFANELCLLDIEGKLITFLWWHSIVLADSWEGVFKFMENDLVEIFSGLNGNLLILTFEKIKFLTFYLAEVSKPLIMSKFMNVE